MLECFVSPEYPFCCLLVLCAVPADVRDESCMRKGSTASLSHIEGALNHSTPPVGLRANSSSHNLTHSGAAADTWYSDGDHSTNVGSAAGDSVTSPVSTTSTKSTGKFFVFGGTRSARKQRQVCGCAPASDLLSCSVTEQTQFLCRFHGIIRGFN